MILAAIRGGQLPGGETFDPQTTALIEEETDTSRFKPDAGAGVTVLEIRDTSVVLDATSTEPSFLVLSDTFYPGWRATVDGQPARIYQTNYVLRGIVLASGRHLVKFEYRPLSLYVGAAGSICSLIVMSVLGFIWRRRGD
jgi:uncharacterized membrane protein YfhO